MHVCLRDNLRTIADVRLLLDTYVNCRSLSGNVLGYLADNCPLVANGCVRQLHSADTQTLVVCRTCSIGDRTFAAAGPQVWNSPPPNLKLCGLSYG